MEKLSKLSIIKLVILNMIVTTIIVLVVTHAILYHKRSVEQGEENQRNIVQDISQVNNNITKPNKELANSVNEILDSKEGDEKLNIPTCPVYIIPSFVPVPQLPPKEVMLAANKDQLVFILYQNIKDHQDRIILNRKRLYDSYKEYLSLCK